MAEATYLLKINNEDYTNRIKVPTYKVNKVDKVKTWTDANHVDHEIVLRSHLSGSFTLIFDSPDEFEHFIYNMRLIRDENSSNYYKNVEFYINNDYIYDAHGITNHYIAPLAKMTFEPENERPYMGIGSSQSGIRVDVEADIV